jgi:Protein of unknown function (DUF1552)
MMRFLTGKHLSRRTVLRGAGTALALPLLESMFPAGRAFAQRGSSPVRAGFIYIPHGATMARWTPERSGTDFELSEILAPLEPFKSKINVISDLSHPNAYGPGGATAHHNRSSAVFLSGAMAQDGTEARLGVTVDQVMAREIGRETPLPSLELMINEGSLSCGDGLSCAYRNTISWQSETSPLPMERNPQVVFERLFGDGSTNEERVARRTQALSLLDAVGEQIGALEKTLPAGDRERLDLFVNDVREIERRIDKAGSRTADDLDIPARPPGIPEDIEEHIKLMMDLQVLAWQADITRITTFQLASELSGTVYPASGVRDAFHTLSHHSHIEENKARFAVLNRYHVGLLAYLLEKLESLPDGDGSLLDNSMLLYGSGMSDGNEHNHGPLPVVLAGGARGALAGGRHLRHEPNTTMSNLLLALLHKVGIDRESFGDSTEALTI